MTQAKITIPVEVNKYLINTLLKVQVAFHFNTFIF